MGATVLAFPTTRNRAYLEHTLQRHLGAAEALLAELDEMDSDPDLEPFLGSVDDGCRYFDQAHWLAAPQTTAELFARTKARQLAMTSHGLAVLRSLAPPSTAKCSQVRRKSCPRPSLEPALLRIAGR